MDRWWRSVALAAVVVGAPRSEAAPAASWEAASEDIKREVYRLRDEGDALFVAEQYLDAAAKYVAALELAPHGKLHFAAGLAYSKVGRWLDAATHLEKAVESGEAMLGADLPRAQAALAEAIVHTGTIVVSSTQRGAELAVDGKLALTAPGTARVRVAPGRHVVIATRGALAAEPTTVEVAAGDEIAATSILYVVDSTWRWPRWQPWAVVGVGVLAAASGAPMILHARSLFADRKSQFEAQCPTGCNPEPADLAALGRRAQRWETASIGTFIGGGALLAAGLTWVALNRPTQQKRRAPDVAFTPWTTGAGLSLTGSF